MSNVRLPPRTARGRSGARNTRSIDDGINTATSSVDVSKATVSRAQAAATAEAELLLAKNNLNRIEPLLQNQYVTVEQVDTQRTQVRVAQGNYEESQAALAQARRRRLRPNPAGRRPIPKPPKRGRSLVNQSTPSTV